MGGVRQRELRIRAVPVADVLAAALRAIGACVVRRPGTAGVVAVVSALLRRGADPDLSTQLPNHLLLLPRRVLQSVLGRPAGLRGRRATQVVRRRAIVP